MIAADNIRNTGRDRTLGCRAEPETKRARPPHAALARGAWRPTERAASMTRRRNRNRRCTPAIESLETRRLMVYQASSESFSFDDLVPGVHTTLLDNSDDGFATIN